MADTQALARTDGGGELSRTEFSRAQVELIRRTVAEGTTDDELAIFLHQCRRTGLDPLARQIHCIVRGKGDNRKATIQTGIDGYRLIAERTGRYAGSERPVYEDWDVPELRSATVTVYKLVGGERIPYTGVAYWEEFYPKGQYTGMWDKMPRLMLAKTAEAQALRKAFPADLSGVYVEEELHQAGAIEGTVTRRSPPRPAAVAAPRATVQTVSEPRGEALSRLPVDEPQANPAERPAPPASQGQIDKIYELGGGGGMDSEALERWCMEHFEGLAPADLTRKQAEAAIAALKG